MCLILDAYNSDNSVRPGFFSHLSEITGDHPFEANGARFSGLIASRCEVGIAFEESWNQMRRDHGAVDGTVLEPEAAMAPGNMDQNDRPRDNDRNHTDTPQLQHKLTSCIDKRRYADVLARTARLPPAHPFSVLVRAHPLHVIVSTVPSDYTCLTDAEWITAVALYTGMADPNIPSEFVGRVFTETNGRNPRVLDKHGHQLSLFMGKGHGKVAAHNLLVATTMHVSRQVGLTASNQLQVAGLFADVIPGPGNAHYRMSAKQQKDGIAPDIMLTNFAPEPGQMVGMQLPTLYDVKGLGFVRVGPYAYGHSAAPAAAAREQLVPAQYAALASRADRKYCATPEGTEGPIAAKLRTGFTGVEGLAFGAFLELGPGFHRLIGKIAHKGSMFPARFGCCHGAKQASGVIAAWATKLIGRAAAKAVAQTRLRALAAVQGTPQHLDSTADEEFAGSAWDAYDASVGQMPFGPGPQ
jgi:hypothetical protein